MRVHYCVLWRKYYGFIPWNKNQIKDLKQMYFAEWRVNEELRRQHAMLTIGEREKHEFGRSDFFFGLAEYSRSDLRSKSIYWWSFKDQMRIDVDMIKSYGIYKFKEIEPEQDETDHDDGLWFDWDYHNFIVLSPIIHRHTTALLEIFTNLCDEAKDMVKDEFMNLVPNEARNGFDDELLLLAMLMYKERRINDCERLLKMYAFVCEKDAVLKFVLFKSLPELFGDAISNVKRDYLGMVKELRNETERRFKLEFMAKLPKLISPNVVDILKQRNIV